MKIRIIKAGESSWVARDNGEVNSYGRATPASRRWWIVRDSGNPPAHMRGVVGFYAANLDEARAKLAKP